MSAYDLSGYGTRHDGSIVTRSARIINVTPSDDPASQQTNLEFYGTAASETYATAHPTALIQVARSASIFDDTTMSFQIANTGGTLVDLMSIDTDGLHVFAVTADVINATAADLTLSVSGAPIVVVSATSTGINNNIGFGGANPKLMATDPIGIGNYVAPFVTFESTRLKLAANVAVGADTKWYLKKGTTAVMSIDDTVTVEPTATAFKVAASMNVVDTANATILATNATTGVIATNLTASRFVVTDASSNLTTSTSLPSGTAIDDPTLTGTIATDLAVDSIVTTNGSGALVATTTLPPFSVSGTIGATTGSFTSVSATNLTVGSSSGLAVASSGVISVGSTLPDATYLGASAGGVNFGALGNRIGSVFATSVNTSGLTIGSGTGMVFAASGVISASTTIPDGTYRPAASGGIAFGDSSSRVGSSFFTALDTGSLKFGSSTGILVANSGTVSATSTLPNATYVPATDSGATLGSTSARFANVHADVASPTTIEMNTATNATTRLVKIFASDTSSNPGRLRIGMGYDANDLYYGTYRCVFYEIAPFIGADSLHKFYVSNTVQPTGAGIDPGNFVQMIIGPTYVTAPNGATLGRSGERWGTFYASGINANASITVNLTSPEKITLNAFSGAAGLLQVDAAGDVSVTTTSATAGDVIPSATNTYDLGSPSFRWKDLHVAGDVVLSAFSSAGLVQTDVSGLLSMTNTLPANVVADSIAPISDSTGTIGTVSARFSYGYYTDIDVSGTINGAAMTLSGDVSAHSLMLTSNYAAIESFNDATPVPKHVVMSFNVTPTSTANDASIFSGTVTTAGKFGGYYNIDGINGVHKWGLSTLSTAGATVANIVNLSPTIFSPEVTNVVSLGTTSLRWATVNTVALNLTGAITQTTAVGISTGTGAIAINGAMTLAAGVNFTVGTGIAAFGGTTNFNNTTTKGATGTFTVSSVFTITGASTFSGALTSSAAGGAGVNAVRLTVTNSTNNTNVATTVGIDWSATNSLGNAQQIGKMIYGHANGWKLNVTAAGVGSIVPTLRLGNTIVTAGAGTSMVFEGGNGSAQTATLSFNGSIMQIDKAVVPSVTATNDLGTTTQAWRNVYSSGGFYNQTIPYTGEITSTFTLTSTFVTYGDSFTAGTGTTQSWAVTLAALVSKTLINAGANGTTLDYPFSDNTLSNNIVKTAAYANYNFIVSYGFNDIRMDATINSIASIFNSPFQYMQMALAAIITMAVPQANIQDARTLTTGGTWINTTAYTFGRTTTNASAQLSGTATGRYVAIRFTGFQGVQDDWTVIIDGVTQAVVQRVNGSCVKTYHPYAVLFDTGPSGVGVAHTVVILNTMTGTSAHYVDFIVGYDSNSAGMRQVLFVEPAWFDYNFTGTAPTASPSISKQYLVVSAIKQAIKTARRCGLQVSWHENNIAQGLFGDGIHWTRLSHDRLARDIVQYSLPSGT